VILTPAPDSADLPIDPDFDDELEAGFAPAPGIDLSPITLALQEEHCGQRLDKVVAGLVPQFSRSRLQQWFESGHITVDGKPARGKDTAYGDETIVVEPQAAPEDTAFAPEPMDLNIVHEDDDIIVINKPAGLVVHPGSGNWSGTLLNGLLHHCPQLVGVPRAGIVHRLDKDTSGLMVVGKTLAAQTDLVRQLQARTVKREYFALVWGTPGAEGGFLIGLIMLSGLVFAPQVAQRRLAVVTLILALVVVNTIPVNPYFSSTLQGWVQGKFLNFNGAAQFLSLAWPFVALWFLLLPSHKLNRQ